MDGEDREHSVHWSDLAKDSYELRLYECFLIFVALLSVGVLAYSYLFENWTIIDSLYFTIVMLSTTGYGDITPSTPGGKLFASLFSLAGIALLGLTLGVFGNRLVEAEIAYSQEIQSKSSSALERAFGKRSSRKRSETEKIKYDAELVRQHAESTSSSLTDTDSECSSVRDEETHGGHRRLSIHGRSKEPSWHSKILSHIPGFAPLFLGGLFMALLEHWKWYDTIYYCVVTATVRVSWMGVKS